MSLFDKYWKKLLKSIKKRWNKWFGKDEEEKWNEGNFVIDGKGMKEWTFDLDCKDQDMSRPNGKPERIWIALDLEGIDYKAYGMIDNRDGIRVRSKGKLDIHVSSFVYAPIPKEPWKLNFTSENGELKMHINNIKCKKGCGTIGDAKLDKIIISPDPGRPAGFKWRNAQLTNKNAEVEEVEEVEE